ncbi:MAG: MFS transporter [Terricaulis sp.]
MTALPLTQKLSWPRRLGWAVGDMGINFYWQGISIFAYFFYTDVMGISPFWAGVALAIASMWDAITDPIMGAIADRTRTRLGRFRPWMLFGSVPCAVAFALMYWTPPLEGAWLVAYAIGTHVLARTMMDLIGIPFSALSARISNDSNERGTLAMLRVIFAATGGLIVAFTVPKLVQVFGDPQRAYFIAACILGVGATLLVLLSFFSTKEPPSEDDEVQPAERIGMLATVARDIGDFWMTLRHNLPLRLLFIALILGGVTGMFGKMLLYWITYDLKDPAAMAWILPLPALILLPCAPIWNWIAQKTSKVITYWISHGLGAIIVLAFYFLNPHDTPLLATLIVLGAVAGSASPIMFWGMLPDTVEYNELKRGVRSEAKIFGFATFAQKIAIAINALILGQLLSQIGFVANQAQSQETLDSMRMIMCLVPFAGGILASLALWKYPINAKYHAALRAEIEARKVAGAAST